MGRGVSAPGEVFPSREGTLYIGGPVGWPVPRRAKYYRRHHARKANDFSAASGGEQGRKLRGGRPAIGKVLDLTFARARLAWPITFS